MVNWHNFGNFLLNVVAFGILCLQFYDDKNVTLIEEKRFNQEHCNDTCFQHYNLTDLVYWGVHLGCWNEVIFTSINYSY